MMVVWVGDSTLDEMDSSTAVLRVNKRIGKKSDRNQNPLPPTRMTPYEYLNAARFVNMRASFCDWEHWSKTGTSSSCCIKEAMMRLLFDRGSSRVLEEINSNFNYELVKRH